MIYSMNAGIAYVVKDRDVVMILSCIKDMMQGGLTLNESLQVVQSGLEERLRARYEVFSRSIHKGRAFASAFEEFAAGSGSAAAVAGLIHAAEASGRFLDGLRGALNFIKKKERFKEKLTAVCVYPAIVLCLCFAAVAVLNIFVIPNLKQTFLDAGVDMPRFVNFFWQASAAMWPAALFFFFAAYFFRKQVFPAFEAVFSSIPFIKEIFFLQSASFFLHAFTLLYDSGVSLADSMERAILAMPYSSIRRVCLKKYQDGTTGGHTLFRMIETLEIAPADILEYIRMAEVTGKAAAVLRRSARILEQRAEKRLQLVSVVFEPLMVLSVGAFIGAMVLIVLLPLMTMHQSLGF